MAKKQTIRGNWQSTQNRSYSRIEKLSTNKGIGYIKTNGGESIVVKVSLKVIVNDVDTDKWAKLETKEIMDVGLAQLFVEGLLL